jgi:chromosome segregation ATPase
MRVDRDGVERRGPAVDLRETDVDPAAAARAVREGTWVTCPDPGPVHERVSPVGPATTLSVRAALADAARTRGAAAPEDEALAGVRAELAALDPPAVDCAEARQRVAEAGDREAALAERVSELRGRLKALEETGNGTEADDARSEREEAVERLAEVRTERIAAEQALSQAREQAREARDARSRRLRLEDRAKNLRRDARDRLAASVRDAFAAAVDAVPGRGEVDEDGRFAGDPVTAALAVVRVADLDAPVVLACDCFESPAAATARLEAPVIRV